MNKVEYAAWLVGQAKTTQELAIGYLRYEAIRKLNPREYAQLCDLNISGISFDRLVDDLIVQEQTKDK